MWEVMSEWALLFCICAPNMRIFCRPLKICRSLISGRKYGPTIFVIMEWWIDKIKSFANETRHFVIVIQLHKIRTFAVLTTHLSSFLSTSNLKFKSEIILIKCYEARSLTYGVCDKQFHHQAHLCLLVGQEYNHPSYQVVNFLLHILSSIGHILQIFITSNFIQISTYIKI